MKCDKWSERILPRALLMLIGALGLCVFVGFLSAQEAKAPSPERALLAADGQAKMSIVLSTNATEATKQVATELAGYLGRISGAAFAVKTGDGSSGIVLGTIQEFPNASLAGALAIRNTYDGKEAYAIRTEPTRVLLLGATDLGASHAAFAFLERLGCRWFFPAKEWEVIPTMPTLAASVAETSRPALRARRIWYAWGFFDQKEGRARCDYDAWARHNRMAASFTALLNHAWTHISREKVFVDHPEYLALVKGERKRPQLCVSTPEVQKIVTQYALDHFAKNPASDMVSVGPGDGGGFCECESCAKLGSVSDQVFFLVNHVAKQVAEKYPGKMVGAYAYHQYSDLPSFPLEPNVYVQLTTKFLYGKKYSGDELLQLWPKACPNVGLYDYYDIFPFTQDMLPGDRGANLRQLRKHIPRYVAAGFTSMDCESGNSWGPHGRGYYVANKLMWDPKTDVEALLADFYERAFGPAASAMKRYYERVDPGNDPIMGEALMADALRDLEEASRLAKDRPDVQVRLDHLKQYLHYVSLRWELNQIRDPAKKRGMTLDALTFVYRTRYSYMNHWEAMRQYWTRQTVKEFKEPDWSASAAGPKPWEVDRPWTPEDTARAFAADVNRFQPQPVETKAFSRDLVPGGFKSQGEALPTRFDYQYPARYGLYSRGGEPLTLTITTRVIADRGDRQAAQYTLTDAAGQVVHADSLPQDGKEHELRLNVPKAGPYWFEFDDKGAGWRIRANPELPCSLALERNPKYLHMGDVSRLYFYVPKGTKNVHYFTQFGWGSVSGPGEKILHTVDRNGVNVTVPVPEGADGTVWSLNNVHLPNIWFFNIPNYVAASPEALLVPKEVAEGDKLQGR